MKKILTALIVSALSSTALAATYQIDSDHTNARFSIDHYNTSTNVGGFYGLTGQLEFDPARHTGSINITIPANTIQTSSPQLTRHLQDANFFNVAQYPQIRFVSNRFNFNGDKLASVDGNLTMKGQTHPVRLTAQKFNCYDNPILKTTTCGGDFTATIDRSRWGLDYPPDAGITNTVVLTVQIEAGRK
ncbi:YceI family protein [Neisseria montereyensis]|uniref:YceI family protein n=1 Tax=Neisseria montereyensis TaxID=2973938 RepID=A0ABT2FC31_9NEIS|nr:YceI family protein [Neisseria montereyensis]MCS4533521.1 YceI family protein [Neisseria montereyensis]